MALRPSTVDVLLKLLQHADANELVVLMDAENVLTLLRDDGWTDDAVRTALKEEQKLPGELLLGLFERGRTAAELLAVLGPKALAAVEAERARPAAIVTTAGAESTPPGVPGDMASAPIDTSSAPPRPAPLARLGIGTDRVQVAGLVLVLAAALAPSMLAIFDIHIALALLRVGVGPVLGLIALLGALGGAIATSPRGRRWTLALSGAVASVGGCLAVIGYALWNARMGRTTLLRLEIAAICMIGMLPALALAAALAKPAREAS